MRHRSVFAWGLLLLTQILCAQDQWIILDDRIPGPDTVWVFTPDEYDSSVTYPTLYMLHGYSSNYQQWHKIMDAGQYANEYNMIIICPDGFYNSWYFDSPQMAKSQFATFFFEKMMPAIEEKYAIDTTNRFITGLSMGGHGAFYLYSLHPDIFRSAGSTSGVMDLRGSSGLFELNDHLEEPEIAPEQWLSMSAVGRLDQFLKAGKELIFDCGTEDPFHEWNLDFYRLALESNLPVTFISQPGKHDWDYWEKSIRAHFEFFTRKME